MVKGVSFFLVSRLREKRLCCNDKEMLFRCAPLERTFCFERICLCFVLTHLCSCLESVCSKSKKTKSHKLGAHAHFRLNRSGILQLDEWDRFGRIALSDYYSCLPLLSYFSLLLVRLSRVQWLFNLILKNTPISRRVFCFKIIVNLRVPSLRRRRKSAAGGMELLTCGRRAPRFTLPCAYFSALSRQIFSSFSKSGGRGASICIGSPVRGWVKCSSFAKRHWPERCEACFFSKRRLPPP